MYIYLYINIFIYIYVHRAQNPHVAASLTPPALCIGVCVYVCLCACMYTYMHTYIHIFVYIFIYIYTEILFKMTRTADFGESVPMRYLLQLGHALASVQR